MERRVVKVADLEIAVGSMDKNAADSGESTNDPIMIMMAAQRRTSLRIPPFLFKLSALRGSFHQWPRVANTVDEALLVDGLERRANTSVLRASLRSSVSRMTNKTTMRVGVNLHPNKRIDVPFSSPNPSFVDEAQDKRITAKAKTIESTKRANK